MQVLLAHGSAAARRRLGRTLRTAGHEVVDAAGAAQALALCRARRPDVLVVASALCERDGLAVIDEVKSDLHAFRTAIVVIAAADLSVETASAELARGAQDFLVEPVGDAELVAGGWACAWTAAWTGTRSRGRSRTRTSRSPRRGWSRGLTRSSRPAAVAAARAAGQVLDPEYRPAAAAAARAAGQLLDPE